MSEIEKKAHCNNCIFDWLPNSNVCKFNNTFKFTGVKSRTHQGRNKSEFNIDGLCKDYEKKPWKFWIK